MGETNGRFAMGWLPDYPDFRDYTAEHEKVRPIMKTVGITEPVMVGLPSAVDLRPWCSPVKDQGRLGSCTAHAGVALVEYYERRAFGKHTDGSRLFLYKTTRNLLHFTGDTGALLRTTMGAMVLFGVPPEEYWPYNVKRFDLEPNPFCYAFGQSFQAITYVRLDPAETAGNVLLASIKTNLAAGLPSMFGFTVYSSINQARATGKIPYPTRGEKISGGHALVAVGYNDSMQIKNTNPGGMVTTGAFLARNSWGTGWGEAGYGWLPYEYVLSRLAIDWWTMLKSEWVDTGAFKL